jgi:DNA-binding transcriptional LysR family regulator
VVRISASSATGQRLLVPLVAPLLEAHPGIRLELLFTDQVVDLVEDSIDIAIRWGQLPPSDMVARRLGATLQVIVGAPDYLARHGAALHPMNCLPTGDWAGPSVPFRTGRSWWTAGGWRWRLAMCCV